MPLYERPIDGMRQQIALEIFAPRVKWVATANQEPYDAIGYFENDPMYVAEVKFRNCSFNKYPDYTIDAKKMASLLEEGYRRRVTAVLVVSWQGDTRFFIPSATLLDTFKTSIQQRRDRVEQPDKVVHIPLKYFNKCSTITAAS